MKQIWSSLPSWAKILSTAILCVLITVGVANPKVFDFITSNSDQVIEESKTVEVKFNIYSKDTNDPLERAEVQFIFDGAPAPRFTNSDGYVRIEIPNRNDVDVVIKKEGFYDLNRTINLKADPNRTITYLLERDKNYSSYNLNGDGFNNGMMIKKSSFQKLKLSLSVGNLRDSSAAKPFSKFIMDKLSNEESEYEIVESNKENPLELVEKIGVSTNSVLGEMKVVMDRDNRTYTYDSALAEDETFAHSSLLYKYRDGKWNRSIIGRQPTNVQISELSEPWDLSNLFLEYPKNPLKLGQSWNLDHLLWSSAKGISDTSLQATLEEITEYEGQPAALISLKGNMSYSDTDQTGDDSNNFSLASRVIKLLAMQFYSDYARDYVLNDIKETIANDLYNDKFSLNDNSMKEKNPDLYNTLVRIYQEVLDDPSLSNYSLSTIKEIVNEKIDRYSILTFLIKILEDSSGSHINNNRETLKIEATVSGKIYRSLEKPIDLYQEVNFVGEAIQDSDPVKLKGEIVDRFSIVRG